jgi:hypothetical protein
VSCDGGGGSGGRVTGETVNCINVDLVIVVVAIFGIFISLAVVIAD